MEWNSGNKNACDHTRAMLICSTSVAHVGISVLYIVHICTDVVCRMHAQSCEVRPKLPWAVTLAGCSTLSTLRRPSSLPSPGVIMGVIVSCRRCGSLFNTPATHAHNLLYFMSATRAFPLCAWFCFACLIPTGTRTSQTVFWCLWGCASTGVTSARSNGGKAPPPPPSCTGTREDRGARRRNR